MGSNTFTNLYCDVGGKTLSFEEGKTTTVTNKLTLRGADKDNLLLLRSTVDESSWYLKMDGPVQDVDFVSVRDSDARPGAQIITGLASEHVDNNFNWLPFEETGERYWRAPANGDHLWRDPNSTNWSADVDGSVGAPVPSSGHVVIFDDVSAENCEIDTDVFVSSISIRSGYAKKALWP